MIGVTLGATGGTEWVPLLCAIVFHQFFEVSPFPINVLC